MQTLGEFLKETRQEKGLSLHDIQQLTKIRTRYLEAIEEDDLEALPGDVYAKGFIKCYAEQVGLDGQMLIEKYGICEQKDPEETTGQEQKKVFASVSAPTFQLEPKRKAFLVQGALIIVVIAGLFAVSEMLKGHAAHSPDPNSISSKKTVESIQGQNSKSVSQSGNQPSPSKSQPNPVVKPKPEDTSPIQPVNQTTMYQTTTNNYVLPADTALNVTLSATTGDCWIDVISDGKEIGQQILKQGNTVQFQAQNDLLIKTGAAPHLTMTIGKRTVVLTPVFAPYYYHFTHQANT